MLQPLALPPGLSVRQVLERVLRLPAVASKRYLTNKVLPALFFCPFSPLHPSLCSPTPGLPHLGTAAGIHQAQGRSIRAGQPPSGLCPTAHTLSLVCMFVVN